MNSSIDESKLNGKFVGIIIDGRVRCFLVSTGVIEDRAEIFTSYGLGFGVLRKRNR